LCAKPLGPVGSVQHDDAFLRRGQTRLMAGLAILKHTFNLSDEELVRRWVENPYFQYFCGEEHFRHKPPFDRSSLTPWRQRMGAERLDVLLQESLAVALKTEAIPVEDLSKIVVDTTVQEKAITFPTDAKLLNRAPVMLVKLARKHGVRLRQGYPRVGKRTLIKHQRYRHAKQFKRAGRELKRLRTFLGRVIRDIDRQVRDNLWPNFTFPPALFLAGRVHSQRPGQRGRKVDSIHAPEVECIGKGKAHKPYEFGVKVSVATTEGSGYKQQHGFRPRREPPRRFQCLFSALVVGREVARCQAAVCPRLPDTASRWSRSKAHKSSLNQASSRAKL
jgi:IS5 family transposase